jgi:hypothetical protein
MVEWKFGVGRKGEDRRRGHRCRPPPLLCVTQGAFYGRQPMAAASESERERERVSESESQSQSQSQSQNQSQSQSQSAALRPGDKGAWVYGKHKADQIGHCAFFVAGVQARPPPALRPSSTPSRSHNKVICLQFRGLIPLVAHRSNFVCASLLAQKLTYLPARPPPALRPSAPPSAALRPAASARPEWLLECTVYFFFFLRCESPMPTAMSALPPAASPRLRPHPAAAG